jgi:hypothetical protein
MGGKDNAEEVLLSHYNNLIGEYKKQNAVDPRCIDDGYDDSILRLSLSG